MHSAALAAASLPGAYLPFKVAPGRLGPIIEALGELGFDGLNVTVPHKLEAAASCVRLSAEASAIGAVNTLVLSPSGYVGHNTDALGFSAAYLADLPIGARVLLLGAGGAARAAARALAAHGLATWVSGRSLSAAMSLSEGFGHEAVPWPDLAQAGPFELVVNATTASSPLEFEGSPPRPRLSPGALVADLNYGRRPNHFQALAEESGADFKDGLAMLAHQARASFLLWTGSDPGLEPFMEAAMGSAAAATGGGS
jgi:shikimate dehydrogenase